MAKGGKMFDAIMIVIIMITIMNYADYIKVDTKLMMVLLSIALYVTAKNMQKSKNQNTNKKVEPLDGSTVAFDKEAFVNLNKIVNELVKKDSVTIPGNLIVKGTTTMENDLSVKTNATVDGVTTCNGQFRSEGEGVFRNANGHYSVINHADGTCYIRGKILLDAYGGSDATIVCHAVVARGNINAGTLTVAGTSTLKGDLNCSAGIRSAWIYTGVVDTDQLKGHAWGAPGHIYCPQNLVLRKDNNNEIVMWDGDVRLKSTGKINLVAPSGVEIPTSVFASGFKNKDNGEEGMFFDQGSLRLQANGNRIISLHTCTGRNSTRSTRYDFEGTAADNVDAYGNIYQRLTDGHGRWLGWSDFSK
jgi:hypothetical protein